MRKTGQGERLLTCFLDAREALTALESMRWPGDPFCPHCGGTRVSGHLKGQTVRAGLRLCRSCQRQFTPTVGTVFDGSHLALHRSLQAAYLYQQGESAVAIRQAIGVTHKTALAMVKRFSEAHAAGAWLPFGSDGDVQPAEPTTPADRLSVTLPEDELVELLVAQGEMLRPAGAWRMFKRRFPVMGRIGASGRKMDLPDARQTDDQEGGAGSAPPALPKSWNDLRHLLTTKGTALHADWELADAAKICLLALETGLARKQGPSGSRTQTPSDSQIGLDQVDICRDCWRLGLRLPNPGRSIKGADFKTVPFSSAVCERHTLHRKWDGRDRPGVLDPTEISWSTRLRPDARRFENRILEDDKALLRSQSYCVVGREMIRLGGLDRWLVLLDFRFPYLRLRSDYDAIRASPLQAFDALQEGCAFDAIKTFRTLLAFRNPEACDILLQMLVRADIYAEIEYKNSLIGGIGSKRRPGSKAAKRIQATARLAPVSRETILPPARQALPPFRPPAVNERGSGRRSAL